MPNSRDEAGGPRGAQRCWWISDHPIAVVDVEQVAKIAVLTLGALYAAGLLIANLELARDGVVRLDPVQPEYVMAAVLWLLLSMVPALVLFAWLGLGERIQRPAQSRPAWVARVILAPLVQVFGSLYLLGAGLGTLLGRSEAPSFQQTFVLAGLVTSTSTRRTCAWQSHGIEMQDARRIGPVALVVDMAGRGPWRLGECRSAR